MSKALSGYPAGVTAYLNTDGTVTITFICGVCHQTKTHIDKFTTGYATGTADYMGEGVLICFACCGVLDRQYMLTHGEIHHLYLSQSKGKWEITNWPGTLRFPAAVVWTGRHNFGYHTETRFARFIGPDGKVWSGKSVGDSEVFHCKRTQIDPKQIRY